MRQGVRALLLGGAGRLHSAMLGAAGPGDPVLSPPPHPGGLLELSALPGEAHTPTSQPFTEQLCPEVVFHTEAGALPLMTDSCLLTLCRRLLGRLSCAWIHVLNYCDGPSLNEMVSLVAQGSNL